MGWNPFATNQTPPTDDQPDPQSFWSTLTGSLGSLGSVLGQQAKGDAQGQVVQGQLDNANNANLINLFNVGQRAQFDAGNQDLERKQFATNNRAQTAKQALVAALLSGGFQPTSLSTPGIPQSSVSGGLARSLLSNPGTLAAMKTLGTQASDAQQTPLSFTGGNLLPMPTLAPPTKISTGVAGKTGGFLQDLGAVAPLLGLLF